MELQWVSILLKKGIRELTSVFGKRTEGCEQLARLIYSNTTYRDKQADIENNKKYDRIYRRE